jgi:hypothetical protein
VPDELDDEQLAWILEALERLREMVFREPPADHLHVERLERSIDGYEEALGRYTATHS